MTRIRRLIPLLTLIAICVIPRFVELPQLPIVYTAPTQYAPVPQNVEPQKAEFFIMLALFVVFLVLSEVLKPKPKIENAKPAGLGDFKFPTAQEGRVVPLIWGTVKQEGPNVVWYGDLRQEAITEKVKTGLFSSKKFTKGYKYYLGMQMALCRGGSTPVGNLLRIWVGEKVLWTGDANSDGFAIDINEPNFLGGNDLGQGGIVGTVRFYRGSMSQTAGSYLSAKQQVGGVSPTYRGTCYVIFEQGYLGDSTTIKPWAFELRRIPNGLGLATPSVNSGNDANPMNVIYEILTNTEWGLGQPSADIDTSNFSTAADTLRTEGNGFSFLLDRPIDAQEFLRMIEQQIDGVVYMNRSTGKWQIKLARGGYSVPGLRSLTAANVKEIRQFSRGSWHDTSNNVLVRFNARNKDYAETYAGAQDMANVKIQGNKMVSVEYTHPGVKDAALGNQIAWRALRTLAYPVARAELVVDRTLYDHNPGDVIRWTDPDLGFTDLVMRITKIDLGKIDEGIIVVTLIQDIFVFDTGVFSAPGQTNWTPPPQTVVAIPTADSMVFEAPRKFVMLDPEQPGLLDRIWAGARFQNDAAVDCDIVTRPGAGSYTDAGDLSGFLAIGELSATLAASGTQGDISFNVDPDVDSLTILQQHMEAAVTQEDCGTRLANLVVIVTGGQMEFFSFKTVAVGGGQLQLSGGYRGFLDTAPATHAANDRVWILLGNLTDRAFAPGATINVKLLPRSPTQQLTEPSATAINVVMDNRGRRPYPPVALTFNSTLWPTGSVNLDNPNTGGPGTGLDDRGVAVGFIRRDYRNGDEAAAVVSEATLPADFPTANTTQYQVEVRNDPAGANTLLFTTAFNAGGNTIEISRTEILRATAGVIPTTLRMIVRTQHLYEGVTRAATQSPFWDFATTAALLSGDFNWANLAFNVASANFTAPSTGTYTLNIGTALGSGNVQANVNGAGFANVITAGGTTGTFTANAGETISIRHTQNTSTSSETFCELTFGGTSIAYAILTY